MSFIRTPFNQSVTRIIRNPLQPRGASQVQLRGEFGRSPAGSHHPPALSVRPTLPTTPRRRCCYSLESSTGASVLVTGFPAPLETIVQRRAKGPDAAYPVNVTNNIACGQATINIKAKMPHTRYVK